MRQYVLLTLDRPIEERAYDMIEIEGKQYDIVPSYDIPGIAIQAEGSFVGQKARLVLSGRFTGDPAVGGR